MARGKILLVDDEMGIRGFFQEYLEDCDFMVDIAEDGVEGMEYFEKGTYDLVISDMMMPRMIGMEFLRRIKEMKPDQKVIMMTGVTEESMVEKAKKLGCEDYITKPLRLEDIESKLSEFFPAAS